MGAGVMPTLLIHLHVSTPVRPALDFLFGLNRVTLPYSIEGCSRGGPRKEASLKFPFFRSSDESFRGPGESHSPPFIDLSF